MLSTFPVDGGPEATATATTTQAIHGLADGRSTGLIPWRPISCRMEPEGTATCQERVRNLSDQRISFSFRMETKTQKPGELVKCLPPVAQ